ncbi:hypothetical protein [Accumulibacter sp.]|uniref:hypothetical protein n=1 Tax=Accumulibacter sp. TaxID=2053492 RepID=UPI0026163189|nr:hypothetical protein [Accumulibacter sp.]
MLIPVKAISAATSAIRPAAEAVAIARVRAFRALRVPDGVRGGLARPRSLSADKARVFEQ